jgi:hypothetical protein
MYNAIAGTTTGSSHRNQYQKENKKEEGDIQTSKYHGPTNNSQQ